jgi:hypothetical protein
MEKFPVFSLLNREISGEGFAGDCIHHQEKQSLAMITLHFKIVV